jgi:hypothetical protein
MRIVSIAAVVALLLGTGLFRYYVFEDTLPLTDQAAFARWILELAHSDHILPFDKTNLIAGLKSDQNGLVSSFLYPIFNQSVVALTAVPLLIWSIVVWAFGYSWLLKAGFFSKLKKTFF